MVACLALAGCVLDTAGPPRPIDAGPAPSGAAATDTAVPARFAEQRLRWTDCGDGLECAAATVPLDWRSPGDGRTIELAVIRRPASGERIGSLLTNPGGPGSSGVADLRAPGDVVSSRLAERFDLVSWDPRGVGESAAVGCEQDPGEIEHWLYDVVEPSWTVDPAGWVAATTTRDAAHLAACRRGSGALLAHVGTDATVRDLDLLRALLGEDRLHYLGFSYGTLLGQRYLDRYPHRVGRIVLDGVVDPAVDRLEYRLQQTAGFELALRRFVAVCPERFGAECSLPDEPAAALAAIERLLRDLERRPVPASDPADPRRLDARTLRAAISGSLYREQDWAELARMLRELDGAPPVTDTAFAQADRYYGFERGVGYTDNSAAAYDAITCADVAVIDDPVRLAAYARRLVEVAPTLGEREPPLPVPACVGWPGQSRATGPQEIRGAGLGPILVVSTTGDPATPHRWGTQVADRLESGVLVTQHGDGHTAYHPHDLDRACVRDAVDDYLIDGTVPAADPHCGR